MRDVLKVVGRFPIPSSRGHVKVKQNVVNENKK